MSLVQRQSWRVWLTLGAFCLMNGFSLPAYADSLRKTVPEETDALPQDARQVSSETSSAGKTLILVGGIGLGVAYLSTVLVGLAGPSSSSSAYLAPVVGPFIQSGRVTSPYDALNITSGILQTGFLITLVTGLVIHASSSAGASRVSILPAVTPNQRGVLVGLSF